MQQHDDKTKYMALRAVRANHIGQLVSIKAMVARAIDEFGQIDILLNNAAAPGTDKWVLEQTVENFNATIAIDLTAAMLCSREVLNASMLERGRGPGGRQGETCSTPLFRSRPFRL